MSQQIDLLNDAPKSRRKPWALCECDQQGVTTTCLWVAAKRGSEMGCFESTLSQRAPFQDITEESKRLETRNCLCVVWSVSEGSGTPLQRERGQGAKGEKMQQAVSRGMGACLGTSMCRAANRVSTVQASMTAKARTEWRQMEMSCKVICLCQRLIIRGWLGRGHQSMLVEFPSAGLHFN